MASRAAERIHSRLSQDINADIFSILMSCELPWFLLNHFQIHAEPVTQAGALIQLKSPPHSEVPGFIHNSCTAMLNRLNCHKLVIDGEDSGGMSLSYRS